MSYALSHFNIMALKHPSDITSYILRSAAPSLSPFKLPIPLPSPLQPDEPIEHWRTIAPHLSPDPNLHGMQVSSFGHVKSRNGRLLRLNGAHPYSTHVCISHRRYPILPLLTLAFPHIPQQPNFTATVSQEMVERIETVLVPHSLPNILHPIQRTDLLTRKQYIYPSLSDAARYTGFSRDAIRTHLHSIWRGSHWTLPPHNFLQPAYILASIT